MSVKYNTDSKQQQVEDLLKVLEDGVITFTLDPEKFKALLAMQALMPSYSIRNIMLILNQMPRASYVASFKKWKELNRFVNKGEKAIRILAPRIKKDEDGKSTLIGYVSVPVFDVSQTSGEPLPIDKYKLTLDGESEIAHQILDWTKQLAAEDNCKFEIGNALGANGYYSPFTHQIVVSDQLSVNHLAKTAVHELVHSRVHRYDEIDIEEAETVAEGTAFVVCSYFGFDTSSYSFEYVRGWSSEEGNSIFKYGQMIQETAYKLITDFENLRNNSNNNKPQSA